MTGKHCELAAAASLELSSPPNAGVAELVDALDLGSSGFICAGSSPVPGIFAYSKRDFRDSARYFACFIFLDCNSFCYSFQKMETNGKELSATLIQQPSTLPLKAICRSLTT